VLQAACLVDCGGIDCGREEKPAAPPVYFDDDDDDVQHASTTAVFSEWRQQQQQLNIVPVVHERENRKEIFFLTPASFMLL